MDGLGWVGDGPDVVGNGWDVMVKGLVLLGEVFFIYFFRFCDRSVEKVYKSHQKLYKNRCG